MVVPTATLVKPATEAGISMKTQGLTLNSGNVVENKCSYVTPQPLREPYTSPPRYTDIKSAPCSIPTTGS